MENKDKEDKFTIIENEKYIFQKHKKKLLMKYIKNTKKNIKF